MTASQALHWHRSHLARGEALYDPRVASRIVRCQEQSACDYQDLLAARRNSIAEAESLLQSVDAILYPMVPIVAPRFEQMQNDADYLRLNTLVLRNSAFVNYLDGCALSLPLAGEGPGVGLTIMSRHGADARVFSVAAALERLLGRWPN